MSKIARIYQGINEIQKYYQGGVLQRLFFDWKKYIGEEINIEYARGYCSNRININGKVYQNLASKLYIGAGNTLMPTETKALEPNGYTHIKLPYPLKPNTSYTIVIDVEQPSEEHAFQLRNAKMEYLTLTIPTLTNKLVKGMNVATFTTSSNEISAILIKNAQNSTKDLIIKNNVIVIEGDLSGETIIEENIKYLEEGTFKPENRIIEGKTYQNLLTNKIDYTFSGSAFYYNKTTLNNGAIYTRNNKEITSEVYGTYITLKCHKVASMLKSNTTYTLAFNIESTFSDYKGITVSGENDCYFKSSTSESNGTRYFHNESFDLSTGYKKIMFETNSNITQYFGFGFPIMQSQSEGTYLKITNIILLEGDYTHIDLPNSINGIESVGKREFVKSKNLYNKKFMNSAITAQGQFVDSRGFIFTINDECTFKINGTNTTGCTIMSENILDLLEDGKSYILSTNLLHFLAIITYKDDTPPKYTSAFTVNKSVMNTIKLYNQWPDTEIVTYDNFVVKNQIEEGTTATEYEPFYEYYPVTIRNYNYKCETDNIILPNGVKNSIDTIDGKKVHVRRVGKIVLDATNANNFKQINTMQVFRWDYFFNTTSFVSGICDKFPIKNVVTLADENRGIRLSGNNFKCLDIKFPDDTGFNINTFRTWLSENPVTVWYELATPIYTYLESGIYDDITIPTSGIKNEIYSENGKWYHKRNIGKVIFDGSSDENWNYYNKDSLQRFFIKAPNDAVSYQIRTPVYLEGYHFPEIINENKAVFLSASGSLNNTLYIYNYDYTTVDDFKAYLAENPLEVYYELAEPVITELYYNNITYKLDESLRSLPNGVCDTIEGNKLIQRVEKIVLTKREDITEWGKTSNSYGHKLYYISSKIYGKIGKCNNAEVGVTSNKFRGICDDSWRTSNEVNNCFMNVNGVLHFLVDETQFPDIESFNDWLGENEVIVYYELATPIETGITPDKILINGEPITDTVGIELPNGTKDSIENGYYVKRIYKLSCHGAESWIKSDKWCGDSTSFFYLDTKKISGGCTMALSPTNTINCICDLFTPIKTVDRTDFIKNGTEFICCSDNVTPLLMISISNSKLRANRDVDEFKTYLQQNPVTVWYELATPVKIPLFSIKEGLTTLKSTNNITPQIELDCLVRDNFQNLCDNEWEVGDIVYGTGEIDDTNSSRIRLINYIKVKPNTKYRMDILNSVKTLNEGYIGARYYDNEKSYLGGGSIGAISKSSIVFTTPENCYYVRFIAETKDVNFKIYLKEVIK